HGTGSMHVRKADRRSIIRHPSSCLNSAAITPSARIRPTCSYFYNQINLMPPTQTALANNFRFPEIFLDTHPRRSVHLPHPVPLRGALAIVTNEGRVAVDAAASGAWRVAGRVVPVS